MSLPCSALTFKKSRFPLLQPNINSLRVYTESPIPPGCVINTEPVVKTPTTVNDHQSTLKNGDSSRHHGMKHWHDETTIEWKRARMKTIRQQRGRRMNEFRKRLSYTEQQELFLMKSKENWRFPYTEADAQHYLALDIDEKQTVRMQPPALPIQDIYSNTGTDQDPKSCRELQL